MGRTLSNAEVARCLLLIGDDHTTEMMAMREKYLILWVTINKEKNTFLHFRTRFIHISTNCLPHTGSNINHNYKVI